MSGKITRAEKCDKHFQEALNKFLAAGKDMKDALRETRKIVTAKNPY